MRNLALHSHMALRVSGTDTEEGSITAVAHDLDEGTLFVVVERIIDTQVQIIIRQVNNRKDAGASNELV